MPKMNNYDPGDVAFNHHLQWAKNIANTHNRHDYRAVLYMAPSCWMFLCRPKVLCGMEVWLHDDPLWHARRQAAWHCNINISVESDLFPWVHQVEDMVISVPDKQSFNVINGKDV